MDVLPLEAGLVAVDAGGFAAKVNGRVASAKVMVRMLVLMFFFSLASPIARLQFHTAPGTAKTR